MKKILLSLVVLVLLTACSTGKGNETTNVDVKDILAKVKEVYGEDYIPTMPLDEESLDTLMGINLENVLSFEGEIAMISTQIDTFIAIQAKDGKGNEVKSDLDAYRDALVNGGFMYPMNMAKSQSSQVIQHGDYVFFVMLGAFDEVSETEEDALKFAQDQTKIGVDAINAFFK